VNLSGNLPTGVEAGGLANLGGALIVAKAPAGRVADEVTSGRMRCPHCSGRVRLWGYARTRWVRDRLRLERVQPRRCRCTRCERTHVILPDRTLVRRLDRVEVIGAALTASLRGQGYRPISRSLSLPATTVRDWIRRFIVRRADPPVESAPGVGTLPAAIAATWSFTLDDLVATVAVSARGASPSPVSPGALWRWASRESQGQLLR
jgi:hypothetical protein